MEEEHNERFYLVRAQEAEALAGAATSPALWQQWEIIAREYRTLARELARLRETKLLH